MKSKNTLSYPLQQNRSEHSFVVLRMYTGASKLPEKGVVPCIVEI
jgi:hypothetical protein